MKRLCDVKNTFSLSSYLKIGGGISVLFMIVCGCTTIGDQFSDAASMAQSLSVQGHKEGKMGGEAKIQTNDDSEQASLANKTSFLKAEDNGRDNGMIEQSSNKTAISIENNLVNQPKSIWSLFSNKRNRIENENLAETLSGQNDSKQKKDSMKENATKVEYVQKSSMAKGSNNADDSLTDNNKKNEVNTDKHAEGIQKPLFFKKNNFSFNEYEVNINKKGGGGKPNRVDRSQYSNDLPGVRPNGGIEIKHRSSLYDDTDIDANEVETFGSIQMASAGGFARNLPNGLRLAHKAVDARCLKPQLINLLKMIERNFNRPVYITSGYRNPIYNRKVNGAKRSLHMSCAAADIIVVGVNKYELAKFVRSLPRRGGVGTYCHQAIHVDVGPRRDWNWSC